MLQSARGIDTFKRYCDDLIYFACSSCIATLKRTQDLIPNLNVVSPFDPKSLGSMST